MTLEIWDMIRLFIWACSDLGTSLSAAGLGSFKSQWWVTWLPTCWCWMRVSLVFGEALNTWHWVATLTPLGLRHPLFLTFEFPVCLIFWELLFHPWLSQAACLARFWVLKLCHLSKTRSVNFHWLSYHESVASILLLPCSVFVGVYDPELSPDIAW